MTDGYLALAMVAVFLLVAEVSKLSFQNLVLVQALTSDESEIYDEFLRKYEHERRFVYSDIGINILRSV